VPRAISEMTRVFAEMRARFGDKPPAP
jgi:hypothetical protein